ncbi:aldo/keto reductase [Streptomyces sp. NPDC051286]|uniref:aldo/keto reductase n=1 Tax=Streptomyces sp. NPDC051286 TaxID=3365647 RepID=UPI0037B1DC13
MSHSVEASLQRLNTDCIDLLWVHFPDGLTPIEEILRGLDDLVSQGKILHAAWSNFPASRVSRAAILADLKNWAPVAGSQSAVPLGVPHEVSAGARDAVQGGGRLALRRARCACRLSRRPESELTCAHRVVRRCPAQAARPQRDQCGGAVPALGFFFVVLPCLAVVSFTCFAACRAQHQRALKTLSYLCLSVGLVCGLTPVGVLILAFTL